MTTISPSESRIIDNTFFFASIVDKEDLQQVARLAAWRATCSFDPRHGSSLRSYRTSAVRNAVHGEASRFHSVFTLRQRDDRSSIKTIQAIDQDPIGSATGPDSTESVVGQMSRYMNLERLSPLEWAILHDRFLGSSSAEELISRFHVSRATFYRTERRLKERIEKEIMHA